MMLILGHFSVNEQRLSRFELIHQVPAAKPDDTDIARIISKSHFKNGHFTVRLPVRLLDDADQAGGLVGMRIGDFDRLGQKLPVPRIIFQQIAYRFNAQLGKAFGPRRPYSLDKLYGCF